MGTKILAATLLLLGASTARAGILLEPKAGIERNTSEQTYVDSKAPTDKSKNHFGHKNTGGTFGVKLGYNYKFLFLAPEIEVGQATDMSIAFGLYFDDIAEAWAGYIFDSKDMVAKGTGVKLGAGVAVSSLFHLNVEYVSRTFDQYTGGGVGDGSTVTYSGKHKAYKLMLSCPILF